MRREIMKCSTFFKTIPAVLLGIVLGVFSTPAFGQPFELDGNAMEGDYPGTDWNIVNVPGPTTGIEAETDLIIDRPEPNEAQFHGGGSKDELDIDDPGWGWRKGAPPAKDDITNAYAAAVKDGTDFVIVFGMDRYDTSGSAQLGFWFFQDTVAPITNGASGSWAGEHQVGDLLVLVNFTKGGGVPTTEVYQWDGITAVPIVPSDSALCDSGWIPTGKGFCGITNTTAVPAPWSYENKDIKGISPTFPAGGFFEGAINLTALGLDDVCFTTFLAESRSSASLDAVLKDFATGGFPVCSISVTKTCVDPVLSEDELGIIYTIKGQVINDGFGTVYKVGLADSPAADGLFEETYCNTGVPTGNYFPLASMTTSACYRNTITVPLIENGTSDTVTATAWTASVGGSELLDTALALCPTLSIEPDISISKKCRAKVEVFLGKVVARVEVAGLVCNTGDTTLSGVTAYDLSITTDPDPLLNGISLAAPADPQNPTIAEGACMEYQGDYYPSLANDGSGNATDCANKVVFEDTVEVEATDIFGADLTPESDMAACYLCTEGECAIYSD
jgi:hypothetical protein